jgi:hypothetical protein
MVVNHFGGKKLWREITARIVGATDISCLGISVNRPGDVLLDHDGSNGQGFPWNFIRILLRK